MAERVRSDSSFLPPDLIQAISALPPRVTRKRAAVELAKVLGIEVSHRSLEVWPVPVQRVNGKALLSTVAVFERALSMLEAAPVTAAKLTNTPAYHPIRGSSASLPDSRREAAELLCVSEPSFRDAIKVQDKGTPALVARVKSGGVAVSVEANSRETGNPSRTVDRAVDRSKRKASDLTHQEIAGAVQETKPSATEKPTGPKPKRPPQEEFDEMLGTRGKGWGAVHDWRSTNCLRSMTCSPIDTKGSMGRWLGFLSGASHGSQNLIGGSVHDREF